VRGRTTCESHRSQPLTSPASFIIAFSLAQARTLGYNTSVKVERDAFGGQEMTSKNVPDSIGSSLGKAVAKAITSCQQSGNDLDHHFACAQNGRVGESAVVTSIPEVITELILRLLWHRGRRKW